MSAEKKLQNINYQKEPQNHEITPDFTKVNRGRRRFALLGIMALTVGLCGYAVYNPTAALDKLNISLCRDGDTISAQYDYFQCLVEEQMRRENISRAAAERNIQERNMKIDPTRYKVYPNGSLEQLGQNSNSIR